MNERGRPRIPPALKEKKGTLQKSREPRPMAVSKPFRIEPLPPAPEWLDDEGRRQWGMLVEQIDRMGIAAKVDQLALTAACSEWAEYVKHRKEQMTNVAYYAIKDEHGGVRSWQPHPTHYIANAHLENFMKIIARFGFTPADRAKLGLQMPSEKEQSKAAKLLKKT